MTPTTPRTTSRSRRPSSPPTARQYYTYEGNYTGRGETNVTLEEEKDDRKAASISWAKDSERFALIRRDNREVGELWVVHVVGKGNDRPELETYSYEMAGEESVTQEEIIVYDLASKSQVTVSHEPWKDEDLRITTQRQFDYPDSEEPDRSLWISDDSEELHFVRLSRDRHRAAVMVADAASGDARMLFVDSLNTYIETRARSRCWTTATCCGGRSGTAGRTSTSTGPTGK